MTPEERIVAAAARVEELARGVSSPPWTAYIYRSQKDWRSPITDEFTPKGTPIDAEVDPAVIKEGNGQGGCYPADALWIATMSPAIAEPLAFLLTKVRDEIYAHGWDEGDAIQGTALELADLILRDPIAT